MGGWNVSAAGNTHQGMVRESNQDAYTLDESSGVYMVADGMGGRAGGEVASDLAVRTVSSEVVQRLEQLISRDIGTKRALLAQFINSASLRIYERSLELPHFRGMGTTATLLWIPPTLGRSLPGRDVPLLLGTAVVAHVGDSRCYLLRAGFLYQITDDHSLVNEQVKAGVLLRNDPMASQIRNVITRCVGYQEEEEVDTFPVEIESGDVFLLCSDGLTNKVRDTELADYMGRPDLETSTNDLIKLSNQRGGEDNITVLLVKVET
jgi:PPM family protein phosphatase